MVEKMSLSGYEQHKQVMAQRYHLGKSGWVYLISLPLQLVATHLPIPDPDQPFPGNRRVSLKHATAFSRYWRSNAGTWAVPPLMLDTVYPLKEGFEPKYEAGGVELGVLALPHNSAAELDILDGQHRILGWKIATDQIALELKDARTELARSKEVENAEGVQIFEKKVTALSDEQKRLITEFVTLAILEGVSTERHKQIFSDIANNAMGITKSVTVSFDRRSVLNRVAMDLAEHSSLLGGRVDFEKDRVTGSNPNLISGKNVSDLVRHAVLGIDGRMTARREGEIKESAIADIAENFLAALVEGFPQLEDVAAGDLEPIDFRTESLLSSATMLRVLAGAYHIIAVDISDEKLAHVTGEGHQEAVALFEELADHMSYPIASEWMDTEVFPSADAKAPSSRSQDLKFLTTTVAGWADNGVPFPS